LVVLVVLSDHQLEFWLNFATRLECTRSDNIPSLASTPSWLLVSVPLSWLLRDFWKSERIGKWRKLATYRTLPGWDPISLIWKG
jgi:hypothetical protein